jgi:bacterioferritin (cytochrome b1)
VVVGARRRATRRAFFRVAGITCVAGASGFAAGCGDDDGATPRKTGLADVDVLNNLLDLEYTAVAAYRTGLPLLRGRMEALGRQFLDQERDHAAALVRAIEDLGGTPHKPRSRYAHPRLPDQEAFLEFVNNFENVVVAGYIDALPKLSHPQLRATAAGILTTEAEHISVLLTALRQPRVPEAFVAGTEE